MLNLTVLLIAFAFSVLTQKKNNKRILFLTFLWLSLCCGLRNEFLGNDTSNYITFFNDIKHFGILYGSDIGFSLISYFLMLVFDNPQILLLIYSLITNYLIIYRLWEFKKRSSFPLLILIYTIIYYPYCFNIVRQFLAVAIVFWATKYLESKKYFLFTFFNIIAISFHTTAIMGFFYLLCQDDIIKCLKINKKRIITVIPILVLSTLLLFSSNIEKYISYLTVIKFNFYTMIIFKFFCICIIYSIQYYQINLKSLFKKKKVVNFFSDKIHLYYLIGIILSLSGMFFSFINRIGFYFLIYEIPFWGSVCHDKQTKKICYVLITFILCIYLISFF